MEAVTRALPGTWGSSESCCWLLLPGSRDGDAHLKHQGAILDEFGPLGDDIAFQQAAPLVIEVRRGTRERGAVNVLPKKFLRWRKA